MAESEKSERSAGTDYRKSGSAVTNVRSAIFEVTADMFLEVVDGHEER